LHRLPDSASLPGSWKGEQIMGRASATG
jgi:hypothetical protein